MIAAMERLTEEEARMRLEHAQPVICSQEAYDSYYGAAVPGGAAEGKPSAPWAAVSRKTKSEGSLQDKLEANYTLMTKPQGWENDRK